MGSNNHCYDIAEVDVLCGRDKTAFNHAGNRMFRVMISRRLDQYAKAITRKEKSTIIKGVVAMVREEGGRFLRWKKDVLQELNEAESHEKVGHAFRDMVLSNKKQSQIRKGRISSCPFSVDNTRENESSVVDRSFQGPATLKAPRFFRRSNFDVEPVEKGVALAILELSKPR